MLGKPIISTDLFKEGFPLESVLELLSNPEADSLPFFVYKVGEPEFPGVKVILPLINILLAFRRAFIP